MISKEKKYKDLLKENEERFKLLSEASFEAIVIHEEGKIIDFNENCYKMLGYTREELRKMSAYDLAAPQYRDLLRKKVLMGVQEPYEAMGLRKDGTFFNGEINAKEFIYKGRKARVVSIRDISDRKIQERELQQIREDYENLIRQSPDGILILDQNGKILFANPGACNIIGVKFHQEIIGRSVMEFVLSGTYRQVRESAVLLRKGQDLPFIRLTAKRDDGIPLEIEYKPVNINYQGEKAVLVVYHDLYFQEQLTKEKTRYKASEATNRALKKEILTRKKIEKKLKTSREQYKEQSAKLNSIIESSSHLVWTINRNNVLTSFNSNYAKYIRSSFGKRPTLLSRVNIGYPTILDNKNDQWGKKTKAAFGGKSQHFETILKKKNGATIWKEIFLNPIFDENGKVKEVSGIGHDITEKKLAEEKIKQSLKEKEVLLQELHHRVKNNLQVISSILNLQSSYLSDEKTIELLKESQNRIKSMSFIHESLYQTKDFTDVNFSEYVRNISNNLLLSYVPGGKKVVLRQKMDNVFLNLDLAIPCGLVINELLSNALKYAFVNKTKGKIDLLMTVDKKENVCLTISDSGPGLPQDIDFRNTQSLGLQLVVVLVSQLHGTISLRNNKGAKFIISFNKSNKNS